ncbi:MAG: hypothetical protein IJH25_13450 [Clostridia bacterium]|nr:hypothetical protein [Clostridia bacterium]MBQ3479163.1 hypothetical protein [Clostridia bacterium]MBQ6326960.1 hypothetical protein [Clostridia bacterium]
MKIYGISNAREFFDRVQRCAGNVYRVDGDGQKKDLKEMAGYLTCSGMLDNLGAIPEINVVLDDPSDFNLMLRYALQLGRDAA